MGSNRVPFLRRNLNRPDEVRRFPNGRIEIFNVGDTLVGRAVYEPGWSEELIPESPPGWPLTPRTTPSSRHRTAGGCPRPLGGTPAVVRRTAGSAASTRSTRAAGPARRPLDHDPTELLPPGRNRCRNHIGARWEPESLASAAPSGMGKHRTAGYSDFRPMRFTFERARRSLLVPASPGQARRRASARLVSPHAAGRLVRARPQGCRR
jgi:hypothetical protein